MTALSIEEIARLRDVWRKAKEDPHTRKAAEDQINAIADQIAGVAKEQPNAHR